MVAAVDVTPPVPAAGGEGGWLPVGGAAGAPGIEPVPPVAGGALATAEPGVTARVGAVPIKNSVYVLPATEQAAEDFQWILREIVDAGGTASITRAEFVDGLTDAEIRRLFRDARAQDYEEIAAEARAVLKSLPPRRRPVTEHREQVAEALARLRKRFTAVRRMDFFGAGGGEDALRALDQIEEHLRPLVRPAPTPRPQTEPRPRGRTWVTRRDVFVDRVASAWLIRRFIDPEASFKFVAPQGYRPDIGDVRFDMFEAEYSHEGDRCTFETLLARFCLNDPGLRDIAEIVHDIDLKDGKFGRAEAAGIERVLAAIMAAHPDDGARLERGTQLLDELYALCAKDNTQR